VKRVKDQFIAMTRRALAQEDVHELIELLLKRETIRQTLVRHTSRTLRPEEAEMCLEYERRVGERLQMEFARLMEDMERLSRKTQAIRRYGPKFPFPNIPAFVEHDV
jgi:hypothetical protein